MTTPESLGETPVSGPPAQSPQPTVPPAAAGYPPPADPRYASPAGAPAYPPAGGSAYPPPASTPGYPPPGGYPPPASGYAPAGGYPPPGSGYPAAPHGYGSPAGPPAAPPRGPSGSKSFNVLGLLSLIAGGLGLVIACFAVPTVRGLLVIVVSGSLLLAAFVLGIVSLFRKGQGKALGIAGVITSVVGSFVGFFVMVAAVMGGVFLTETEELFDSVDEQTQEQALESPEASDPGPAQSALDDPLPVGSTVTSDGWEVTVNSVALAQTDVVLAENAFNEAPAPGYEYILVNVTVTYIGDTPDGEMPGFVSFDYVTESGETTEPVLLLVPDELDRVTSLQHGGTATGNIVLVAPTETAAAGVIAVTPGLMDDPEFFAAQ